MNEAMGLEKIERRGVPIRRLVIFYLGILLAVFLLGFLPMWLKAREVEKQKAALQAEIKLARLKLALGTAAIDARRGEYEPARLQAVEFFQGLTDEMQKGTFAAAQQADLQKLMEQRDMVITLLARSDPAAAERLSNMHVTLRKSLGQ